MQHVRQVVRIAGFSLLVAACGGAASQSPSIGLSPAPSPVALTCDIAEKPFDPEQVDLTGPWTGDDGGIYYLRQLETVLWWSGMSGRDGPPEELGRGWNNVARGEIDGLKISVEYADVPRGGNLGSGTLTLTIQADETGNIQIVKDTESPAGFGSSVWTPCTPG